MVMSVAELNVAQLVAVTLLTTACLCAMRLALPTQIPACNSHATELGVLVRKSNAVAHSGVRIAHATLGGEPVYSGTFSSGKHGLSDAFAHYAATRKGAP